MAIGRPLSSAVVTQIMFIPVVSDVTVEREGWCDEEIETIEGLKNVVFLLVSSFFEDIFKDADLSDVELLVNAVVALSSEETDGEEVLNFVKGLDSAENVSGGVEGFVKFLEGLGESNENNEVPPEEIEEPSEEIEEPSEENEDVDLENGLNPEVLLD